jgi:hypothetical protein
MPIKDRRTGGDQDIHKGAMGEDRPGPMRPDAPGLDEKGLPNDATTIARDRPVHSVYRM